MSVFGTIETCLPARQMSAYDFIVESNPVRVIDVIVDLSIWLRCALRGGAGGDWSAIVPPLVCLPSGISLLRDFYVAKVTTSSSRFPAFHEHTLIAGGKCFRMAGNCGAPADSTLAHDVAGDDGVTVSG
jgi:hypothetical protein